MSLYILLQTLIAMTLLETLIAMTLLETLIIIAMMIIIMYFITHTLSPYIQ